MQAPIIFADIWGEEIEEKSYWTVRYFNANGFGVEKEWTNVYGTEAEVKEFAQLDWYIPQGCMYRVYAFKQESRVF